MTWIDWLIVLVPTLAIGWLSAYSLKYVKGVAGFMAGHRAAGRYLIANAKGEMGVHVVSVAALFEVFYKAGFTMNFWQSMTIPVTMFIALLGWVIYRYRETRAMTVAQFFEIRYSKRFRIFAGIMAFVAGVLNYGIMPAVASRFFVFFCGLPQELHFGLLTVPTFIVIMLIYLPVSLMLTLTGGQLTIMVTDCIEGLVSLFFYFFISIFLIMMFSWTQMHDVLISGPPGLSAVDPYDTSKVSDFNIWFVLIGLMGYIYATMAWQGGHAFNSSAANPHEAKMAGIIGIWREFSRLLFTSLLALCAYTFLKHPDFSAGAQEVGRILSGIADPRIADQMRMPVALGILLPMGIKGIVCAMFFLAMLAGDGSMLHSWGSIFIQDIVVPLRKTPLSPKLHLLLLRLAVLGVAVFGFVFSILYRQTDYILMFLSITGAIYVGGAGAVIIGGLYWKKGTASAAWCSMLTGSCLALSGMILQQPSVWEGIRSFLCWGGNNLSFLNCVADLNQLAVNMPSKFPLNGRWISFFVMVISAGSYVGVSLLTCREDFNMDRMLHRGKYAVDPKNTASVAAKKQSKWMKLIGIDSNFTLGDRLISISLFSWKMFWVLFLGGIAVWNLFRRWPVEWWVNLWRYQAIYIPLVLGAVTAVWILWGGIRDLYRLSVYVRTVHQNEKDDGMVVDHHNLDENGIPGNGNK